MAAPLRSSRVPRATPSETVSTASRIGLTPDTTPSTLQGAVLVERRAHDLGGEGSVPDDDLDRGPGLGRLGGDVGEPDPAAERGAQDPARHLARGLALEADLVVLAREGAV